MLPAKEKPADSQKSKIWKSVAVLFFDFFIKYHARTNAKKLSTPTLTLNLHPRRIATELVIKWPPRFFLKLRDRKPQIQWKKGQFQCYDTEIWIVWVTSWCECDPWAMMWRCFLKIRKNDSAAELQKRGKEVIFFLEIQIFYQGLKGFYLEHKRFWYTW